MASLAGVTDQLQRQNQQELASVIRIANEQLVSSGARQGLDEIAKIFEAQQGTSLEEFKATKKQIVEMQRDLANLEGVNSEEKRMLQRVLETSQASIGENVTFKKSIGELTANTVESSIDSIGGMVSGALSGSPILSFGASFVGDRFQQFKENRKAAKEAQKERADKIAREAEQEEREFSLLRSQMDNASVAAASGKTQEEIDSLSLDQLNEEKNVIIQRAFAAKQEADLQEEDRKRLESVQDKFGLDRSTDSPSSTSNNENNNDRDNSRSVGEVATDVIASTQRREIISLLADIDGRLHGSPDYLKTLNEKIDTLIKDDPSSLDIENQRELKRHQKKMERLSQNQVKATNRGGVGKGSPGDKGGKLASAAGLMGIVGDALSAYGFVKGTTSAMDMFKSNDPNKPVSKNDKGKPDDGKKTDGGPGKKRGMFKKLLDAGEKIPRFGKLIGLMTTIAGGVAVADAVSDISSSGSKTTSTDVKPTVNPSAAAVTATTTPPTAANKPGFLSRAKAAIAEKMPFRSTTVPAGATVGRGPDGRFTSLIPDNVPEVTKPAGAGKSMMGGLKTAGNFVGRTAVPLTVALGAMEAGSILMDDEMTGDQKVNAGAKLAGGTAGAAAGFSTGATIGATVGSIVPFVGTAIGAGVGGLLGGGLGYLAGEYLGGMGAEASGFSETATEEELIKEKKLKNDKRLVEIQNEMMEAGDRMARSKSGENVYYGREHKGIEEDEQKIKELEEELDRLNITAKKPEVKPESKMPKEGDVEPRPKVVPMDRTGTKLKKKQKEWDDMYGETHNNDGTLKKVPENLGKVELNIDAANQSSAFTKVSSGAEPHPMSEKTEGITEKYFGKEMTYQELEDGIKSGSVKRSIGRKLQKKIVMTAENEHPERFVKSAGMESARQETQQSMRPENVSASDTAVNAKVAAGETLKSSALNQGNKNSNNNVVGNNNTSNTSVTNNTQNVKRVDNGGVRNPDPTATRARIGLGMGMAF